MIRGQPVAFFFPHGAVLSGDLRVPCDTSVGVDVKEGGAEGWMVESERQKTTISCGLLTIRMVAWGVRVRYYWRTVLPVSVLGGCGPD